MPLTPNINNAYYVVSNSSQDVSGKPNTIWLGIKSLDGIGTCAASKANQGSTPLGALVKSAPNETDPVSGEPFTQKNPSGSTVNGFYFGYQDWVSKSPCTTQASYRAQLQTINEEFAAAARRIVTN